MTEIIPLSRWEEKEGDNIVGIDIDGVLNNYPTPWVEYVNKRYGRDFPNDLNVLKDSIPYNLYKQLKKKYI